MESSYICVLILLLEIQETAVSLSIDLPQQTIPLQKNCQQLPRESIGKGANITNVTDSSCKYDGSNMRPCKSRPIARALYCDLDGNVTGILPCYCITYNESLDIIELGLCKVNCFPPTKILEGVYHRIPTSKYKWNSVICGKYHRNGTLCGKCQDDLYLQAYSYDLHCIECSANQSNWWWYVLLAYLPLTLFYLVILLFKINIPASKLQGFALCTQLGLSPQIARLYPSYTEKKKFVKWVIEIAGIWFGIWNFDFIRLIKSSICFQISSLSVLALNLVIAVYPLLLMIVTYKLLNTAYLRKTLSCPLRPQLLHKIGQLFKNRLKMKRSTVDAFATCMFLSFGKFLTACADLLVPVTVYRLNGSHTSSERRLYFDATIVYFSKEHLPYAILAIVMLLIFVLLPTMILLLYSFKSCQRCLQILPVRCQIFIYTFTDSFQGCYNNGTVKATRDCRWFSAVPFLLQIALTMSYGIFLQSTFISTSIGLLAITAIIALLMDPYKKATNNPFTFFILLFASILAATDGINVASIYQNFFIEDVYLMIAILSIIVLALVSIIITFKSIFEK